MMVRAVVPPTVPHGTQRVRVCLHAGNTTVEVETLVRALEEWCEQRTQNQDEDDEDKVSFHARL